MRSISVIGLGYVGLPVAVAFGRIARTIGFDIDTQRLQQLRDGIDNTGEILNEELNDAQILLTHKVEDLKKAEEVLREKDNNYTL